MQDICKWMMALTFCCEMDCTDVQYYKTVPAGLKTNHIPNVTAVTVGH